MRKRRYLRRSIHLGTSLTALFLLVRCAVIERDYSIIDRGNAGTGGGGGSGGDNTGGTSAGTAGLGGMSGLGGSGGREPPPPVPCDLDDAGVSDAGSLDAGDSGAHDAGAHDAGGDASSDTGADPYCACVDGFYRAVDADGDGAGTRLCAVAPGEDCDDSDETVTHNACGGCTALPNAVGEDCLDCGAYACDGPDALVCATKPDYFVVDPDCRCQAGLIVARDTDEDGAGTRLCEENPGTDCNDGDATFITNQCGGCDTLPGTVGADCNQCGTYTCSGTALVCAPKTGSAGRRCLDDDTRQTCGGTGFWGNDTNCTNVCYLGNCEICTPGTFQCYFYATGDAIYQCVTNASIGSSSSGIGWASYSSCSGTTPRCNPTNGTCTSHLLLPRDRTFEVVPRLERGGLPWHDVLNTASDSDYG